MDEKKENKSSKTYCPYPFEHVATRTDGQFTLCCYSYEPLESSTKMSPEQWFHGEKMDIIRSKMLKGEKVDHCKICYDLESQNLPSARNRRYPHHEKIDLDHLKILSFDLRVTNLCNLRCATCGPNSSTSWEKELGQPLTPPPPQLDLSGLDDLELFYIAGGEPFLRPDLDYIILNLPKKTRVEINSNFTIVKKKDLEALKQIEYLSFVASYDGTNEYFDLLRYPHKHDAFIKQLLFLSTELPLANFNINCVVSIFNLENLIEVSKKALKLKNSIPSLAITFTPLVNPAYLHPQLIPFEKRLQIIETLLRELDGLDDSFKKIDCGQSLKKILTSLLIDVEISKKNIENYKTYLQWLRENRKLKTWPNLPEL